MKQSIRRLLTPFMGIGYLGKWIGFPTVIGLSAGLGAVAFERGIHVAQQVLIRFAGVNHEAVVSMDGRAWLVIAIPALGGLLTGIIVTVFAPEAEGHGTDSVIKAFHRLKGVVRGRIIFLKPLASMLTIGSGGSAGQEGPVAQFGAGVGSWLASTCRLTEHDRRIFLLSGAAGGVGAMFCSPMGAALFLPEVLYRKPEFEGEAIIPCIISSIAAYTTFTTITGKERAIPLDSSTLDGLSLGDPRQLAVYLVLAILCTAVGWAYVSTFYGTKNLFDRMRLVPEFLRPALGGALLGILALFVAGFTSDHGILFGGYGLIVDAIQQSIPVQVLIALLFAKILATTFTISSGGSGGVFAPSLAMGALLGAAVGQTAAALFPTLGIRPAAVALVGMGGFFAGVSKTPIASVVMVCEMTGGYGLLAPLLLVAVVHMLLSDRWSLYHAQVPGIVDSQAHTGEFVVDVLEKMTVEDILAEARKPQLVHEDTTLRQVLRLVAESKESYFPVVDDKDDLVGVFSLTDLRRLYLEDGIEDLVIARDFMVERVVTAERTDTLHDVLGKMTQFHINTIPIVASDDPRKVMFMLQRNDLGRGYDRRLKELREPSTT